MSSGVLSKSAPCDIVDTERIVHVKADCGVQTLTASQATTLAGTDPDYNTRKLYEAISGGNFPKWTVYIQTMTPTQAEEYHSIVLDVTKTWPQATFPLREVGILILNRNSENFFDEIEQLAFSPAHLIPYIEHSPDPLLQARLFIYSDTQRYRLGVNNAQLPCNASIRKISNFHRGGAALFLSQGSSPNYSSSIPSLNFVGPSGAIDSQIRDNNRHERFDGSANRDLSMISTDDFVQPHDLWARVWNRDEQRTFVDNISGHLSLVRDPRIQDNQLLVFQQVDQELANRIAMAINRPPP